ncbi:hypothetical protein RvY_07216, partial [Ramazzottius varieornatus]
MTDRRFQAASFVSIRLKRSAFQLEHSFATSGRMTFATMKTSLSIRVISKAIRNALVCGSREPISCSSHLCLSRTASGASLLRAPHRQQSTQPVSRHETWKPILSELTLHQPEVQHQGASCAFSTVGDTLTIQQGNLAFEVPFLWLRDSCTCDKCVNQSSFQRNSWTIQDKSKLKEAQFTDGNLVATWTDGHITKQSLRAIQEIFDQTEIFRTPAKESVIQKRIAWDASSWSSLSLPAVTKAEVLTEGGLKQLLLNIHLHGYGLVSGCEPTETDTEAIVRRIAAPMPTTFSPGMWTFTSNMARGDTAYSNCYLAPHTDSTYFSNPCRIQVFHCLDREGCTGGDTILVDGQHCAEVLEAQDPAAMDLLCRAP